MFRGFLAVIPVLLGLVAGYALSLILGIVDLNTVSAARWVELPQFYATTFNRTAILMIMPAALVVLAEHIGHLVVTGNIVGRDLVREAHIAQHDFIAAECSMVSCCAPSSGFRFEAFS